MIDILFFICYNFRRFVQRSKSMTGFLVIIFMLLIIVFMLIGLAVAQIKMAGMNVKDFWTFIKANETLNKLYAFSKKYEKLTTNEQLVFLREAERVFEAFDKVPNVLWEEDYQKYMEVLSTYKDIKIVRWESNQSETKIKFCFILFFYMLLYKYLLTYEDIVKKEKYKGK